MNLGGRSSREELNPNFTEFRHDAPPGQLIVAHDNYVQNMQSLTQRMQWHQQQVQKLAAASAEYSRHYVNASGGNYNVNNLLEPPPSFNNALNPPPPPPVNNFAVTYGTSQFVPETHARIQEVDSTNEGRQLRSNMIHAHNATRADTRSSSSTRPGNALQHAMSNASTSGSASQNVYYPVNSSGITAYPQSSSSSRPAKFVNVHQGHYQDQPIPYPYTAGQTTFQGNPRFDQYQPQPPQTSSHSTSSTTVHNNARQDHIRHQPVQVPPQATGSATSVPQRPVLPTASRSQGTLAQGSQPASQRPTAPQPNTIPTVGPHTLGFQANDGLCYTFKLPSEQFQKLLKISGDKNAVEHLLAPFVKNAERADPQMVLPPHAITVVNPNRAPPAAAQRVSNPPTGAGGTPFSGIQTTQQPAANGKSNTKASFLTSSTDLAPSVIAAIAASDPAPPNQHHPSNSSQPQTNATKWNRYIPTSPSTNVAPHTQVNGQLSQRQLEKQPARDIPAAPSTPVRQGQGPSMPVTPASAKRDKLVPDILAELEAEFSDSSDEDAEPEESSTKPGQLLMSNDAVNGSTVLSWPSMRTGFTPPPPPAALTIRSPAIQRVSNTDIVERNSSVERFEVEAQLSQAPPEPIVVSGTSSSVGPSATSVPPLSIPVKGPQLFAPLFIDSPPDSPFASTPATPIAGASTTTPRQSGVASLPSSSTHVQDPAWSSPRKRRKIAEVVLVKHRSQSTLSAPRPLKTGTIPKPKPKRIIATEVEVGPLPSNWKEYKALNLWDNQRQQIKEPPAPADVPSSAEIEIWQGIEFDSLARGILRHCHWRGCGAVLETGATLQRHVELAHRSMARPTHSGLFLCLWNDCAETSSTIEQFQDHILSHLHEWLYCAYQGCGMRFQTNRMVAQHHRREHKGGGVKEPFPTVERVLAEEPPPIPDRTIPAYLSTNLHVHAHPISKEYHMKLGPWVLRNIYGHVNGEDGPEALASQDGTDELYQNEPFFQVRDQYDFLPSSPSYIRFSHPLRTRETTDFSIGGNWALYGNEGERDEGLESEDEIGSI